MAERHEVFQWGQTISIPRNGFRERVVLNEGLTTDDLRVCLLLLTELNGWDVSRREKRLGAVDPMNYKSIDYKRIATVLHLKKKEVKECVRTLIQEGILEDGQSNGSVERGFRFTF